MNRIMLSSRLIYPGLRISSGRRFATAASPELDKYVKKIKFGNPKKRNALSLEVLEQLEHDLLQVNPNFKDFSLHKLDFSGVNKNVRCIVLESEGPVFSSGHDLKELLGNVENPEYLKKIFRKCSDVMLLVRKMPQPVIASIANLVATAAGTQLVAQCDLAVCGPDTTFATPGSSIGLFCTTPSVPLATPLSIPSKVALKMLLTAEAIPAQDALTHGLVSHVATSQEVVSELTMEVARKVSAGSPKAILLGKWAYWQKAGDDLEKIYRFSEQVMVANLSLNQASQGIGGFVSKKPVDGKDWSQ